jgi:Xaa-Pro aminopeptidase
MDRRLEPGDLVALDIIGACQGYQFDVNRSTVVGEPDDRQRRLLEAVYLASRQMVEHAWPGTPATELVRAARRCLDELGFGAHAARMMGHGIGLETVEEPYITADSEVVLEPGMVLAVEPGVFIPGWGGANIEEIIVVRDGPPEVLTLIPARLW